MMPRWNTTKRCCSRRPPSTQSCSRVAALTKRVGSRSRRMQCKTRLRRPMQALADPLRCHQHGFHQSSMVRAAEKWQHWRWPI